MYITCTAHVYRMYMYASKEDIIRSLSTGTQSSIAIKDVLNVKCYKVQANYNKILQASTSISGLKRRQRERERGQEGKREGRKAVIRA